MNKISCDVTKDLLAPYLDGICSEESRRLVEEHVRECADCRRFRDELSAPEMQTAKEEKQIDFLKKINLYMKNERATAIFLAVLLASTVLYVSLREKGGMVVELFGYALFVPLAITYTDIFRTGQKPPKLEKGEWHIAVGSLISLLYVAGLQAVSLSWVRTGSYPAAIPAFSLGPFMACQTQIAILIGVAMLAIHVLWFRKRQKRALALHGVVWCGIAMGFEYLNLLHNLNEPDMLEIVLLRYNGILILETLAVFLICKKIHAKKMS